MTIETQREGRVLIVRISNPPHNFMTREMVGELDRLVRSLRRDRSVGSVLITGAADGLFITHYSIEEIVAGVEALVGPPPPPWLAGAALRLAGVPGLRWLIERTPVRGLVELRRIHAIFGRMNRLDKAFVAAINGNATGGGCELALACDVRYMAEGEFRIGLPEMTLGFNPGAGGTQRLPRAVGASRALEMMLEGRTLTAGEAERIGLVHAAVPPERLQAEAMAAAERLARRSPVSIRGLKRAVYEGADRRLPAGLRIERNNFLPAGQSKAAAEAMRAYVAALQRTGSPPWADPETIRPWQEGTAADLLGDGDAKE